MTQTFPQDRPCHLTDGTPMTRIWLSTLLIAAGLEFGAFSAEGCLKPPSTQDEIGSGLEADAGRPPARDGPAEDPGSLFADAGSDVADSGRAPTTIDRICGFEPNEHEAYLVQRYCGLRPGYHLCPLAPPGRAPACPTDPDTGAEVPMLCGFCAGPGAGAPYEYWGCVPGEGWKPRSEYCAIHD